MVHDTVSGPPIAGGSAKSSTVFMIVLRLVFVLVLIGVGWGLASDERFVSGVLTAHRDLIVIGFTGAALVVIALDIFVPRKSG